MGKVLALLAKPLQTNLLGHGSGARAVGKPDGRYKTQKIPYALPRGALLQWRTLRAWIGARRYPNGKCRRRGLAMKMHSKQLRFGVYRIWGGEL